MSRIRRIYPVADSGSGPGIGLAVVGESTTSRPTNAALLYSGVELGRILSGQDWISVHAHGYRAMWLCRDGDFERSLGLIQWDLGKSPQWIMDTDYEQFDQPNNEEIVDTVRTACALWRCVVHGESLDPTLRINVSQDLHPKPMIVYKGRCA